MKENTPHSLHKHNTPRRRLFAPSLLFTSLLLSGLASAQELSVPCDELEEKVLETLNKSANTGQIGDGKIFVFDIKSATRIRTGETGNDALS